MDCSTPGFRVHHQLPGLTQAHVHRISDAIQPPHPLSSPSPPAFNLSQHHSLFPMSQFFTSGSQSIVVSASTSVLPMNMQELIPFRMDCLDLLSVQETVKSLLQHHSSKSIDSSVLSFLYSPTLTSIHDYWKNHSFD